MSLIRKINQYILCIGCGISSSLFARADTNRNFSVDDEPHEIQKKQEEYPQWFVGPVIAFTPITMDVKHPAIEPITSFNWTYGYFDKNGHFKSAPKIFSVEQFIDFQFGVNSFLGFEVLAAYSINFCEKKKSSHFNDTEVNVGFQISTDTPNSWIPDFRIILEEIFPTGKYKNGSPSKHNIDITGEGSFQTGINFVFQKFFPRKNGHNIRISGSIGGLIPSFTTVNGSNFYGMTIKSSARVKPGACFNSFFVFEYEFSRVWGMTIESNFFAQAKGKKSRHQPLLSVPQIYEFSIAPEIQHTFSENFGMSVGGWFSVLGKNSNAFAQVFLSLLYVF